MSLQTLGKRPGDWLAWEADNLYSREVITILAGDGAARELTSGMVLGKITKGAAVGAIVSGADTITTAPTVGAAAKVGVYRLTCIVAGATGKFNVEDPDGVIIGQATVGTEFTTHLTFTITDAGVHAAVGDVATITVAAGSGSYVQVDSSATNGAAVAAAVLLDDATAPDGTAVSAVAVVRQAVVNSAGLTWPTAWTTEKVAALAQLKSLGIVSREAA